MIRLCSVFFLQLFLLLIDTWVNATAVIKLKKRYSEFYEWPLSTDCNSRCQPCPLLLPFYDLSPPQEQLNHSNPLLPLLPPLYLSPLPISYLCSGQGTFSPTPLSLSFFFSLRISPIDKPEIVRVSHVLITAILQIFRISASKFIHFVFYYISCHVELHVETLFPIIQNRTCISKWS